MDIVLYTWLCIWECFRNGSTHACWRSIPQCWSNSYVLCAGDF